jgi:hypothetical protein
MRITSRKTIATTNLMMFLVYDLHQIKLINIQRSNLSSIILQRVEPLLCNDCEMSGYTGAVSGQRLSKHVPVAIQQILNSAIIELQQWKSCVF